MKKSIKVAIIGCGDIAGGYDERKRGNGIFSHAGAYKSMKNVEIDAAYDINKARLYDFCRYWSVKMCCGSLSQLLENKYGVVSVCSPDETHAEILERIIKSGCTKYIWVEKPLTTNAKMAEKVIQMARKKKVGLWLTSQRRWDPAHAVAKEIIEDSRIGQLLHINGYYTKGIRHIGCSMVDTLRFLCGEIAAVKAFSPFKAGSYGTDYSLRGLLWFRSGATASIVGCDLKKYVYSIFEIDITGTKGRIRIEENGDKISIYGFKTYDYYPGFSELTLTDKITTKMRWAMKYGLRLLLKNLSSGKCSTHSAEEGLRDLRVVDALRQSARQKGIKIEI